ncbi:predicted protein, partial [Phaeodactylum tricornutum CCAP 1055/1]
MFAFDEHTAAHHDDQLLEIHVDEETDTKTLVGSYTTTDVPGEFEWRPGALTRAIRSGKWVLLEDLDSIPIEIQASLVQLLKSRLLPLGNGKVERCHPNFRLFGTLTILPDVIHPGSVGGKRILSPTMWRHIRIEPLPLSELKEIAVSMHKEVPGFVVDCVLKVFTALDQSGRTTAIEDDFMDGLQLLTRAIIGRNPSVRDLFKVLTLCLAETYDIFVAACPDRNFKEECLRSIFAPTWGVSADLALSYIDRRRPEPVVYPAYTEVGRARIPIPELYIRPNTDKETFAQTSYALRLMESIGVCIAENEPTLLVGETGCGKTTILQHLARLSGRDLVVQNLSLQTDSTDLLGGFRPLEIQQVARSVYQNFVDLFTSSFSRKQNADFLAFTSDAMKRGNWKRLSQCFRKAAKLGIDKVKERSWDSESSSVAASWRRFEKSTGRFEQQRLACNSGLAFVFAEGALIEAITRGKWVLLDEINLASSETLQRLCGLLDDPTSSITLTERGDGEPVERHPDFRLFAAMNPATDSGKKDLHASIRSRFTELYVDELLDPLELRVVAERYICAVLPVTDTPPEHTETVVKAVDVYLECRSLAERVLVDGSGQKPRYTLRTLSRALTASQIYVLQQKLPLQRALYEGFELAFQGPLSQTSLKPFCDLLTQAFASGLKKEEMDHPGRRPGGTAAVDRFALIKPFWIEKGPLESIDWSELNSNARSKFVLTRSTTNNLRRLARAVASGPWPILLEGPTSAGKTSLVEYLAARCGHHVIRINNHEHTDVQEYTGSFAADSSGRLAFQDGLLALNRLLDDNRELYLPETNETVRPKHGFRLFATQNPSGVYGGRKPLSRAFRNRFTELHLDDIPSSEMITILEKRSGCPPQHAKILVSIMDALRLKRSKSGVFLGKNSFITPRDLLRWAERHATGKIELAHEGFMLLGERLRTREEKDCVREEIEKHLNVKIDLETLYFSESSEARSVLHPTIAPTRSLLRLVTLVLRCVRQREPVLLVGDTGCGKTTAVQLLSCVLESELHTINCHATTETSDLLGGLRPVRDLARAYNALFEWSDGPLVKAVKAGDMILLDEISLAEDAVLERLNSVLEPSRTLVLAEKGSADDVESRVLIAHECFQLFATMNPGGDFGKRELSPALRSRFTEIWVPAVTDSADIDFVLERSLAQSAFEEGTRNDVKRKMIEYFNWFNEHLCTDPSRPYAELALSLRDILTWAAFITACTQAGDDLDIWGIYYHGACLMHLDGLGLGTALASHDSASAKNKAIEFLMEHVPVDKRSTLGVMTNGFNVLDAKFGCNTFRIPVGQDHVAEADFNLEAPTTSVNIFRILRAMQLSKPVLLEGSPGVGKTTLVAALAAASGHKLVRINLSDQTDISDLFGSDLPVPEKDASGNNSASFSWCDGVLLSAIKKGDWVLLDELNLASQAVLEGLNSCLDHRASVYIPELGSSFRCPASFRIFAAQNPLAQGGGRKGLPKSFLNRFTKVFVDSLTDDDLRVILTAKFPSLDEKLIDRVIAFNSRINCDVVQDRLYGQSGAPWEFNLRDVFRWCELLRFDLFGQISISLPLVLARDLYFQRFRAQHDREIAKERYLSIFGSVDQKDPRCKLATTPLEVLVGSVRLARLRGPDITRGPYVVESPLSLIHFQALEAVARCISKNWPCLLVGPAVVGKSSTIGCLAELTGRKLVEICLSPSSDVSELVGCFEQVDGLEDYRVAFASICRVAEEYLLLGGSETEKLRSRVDLNPIVWDDLAASRDLLLNYNGKMSTIGGHFVWKDGILIEAMEKGYWLHLKHVNLCPASVLDRLNSVMEPNGSLLLAECSSAGEDGGTRHRQVHCHPDFRIFLSMNPEYGEVSRAMRNRCVEIALMDHPALAYE